MMFEYLSDWEDSVEARKKFSDPEKKRMMLSEEIREGLRITSMLMYYR